MITFTRLKCQVFQICFLYFYFIEEVFIKMTYNGVAYTYNWYYGITPETLETKLQHDEDELKNLKKSKIFFKILKKLKKRKLIKYYGISIYKIQKLSHKNLNYQPLKLFVLYLFHQHA